MICMTRTPDDSRIFFIPFDFTMGEKTKDFRLHHVSKTDYDSPQLAVEVVQVLKQLHHPPRLFRAHSPGLLLTVILSGTCTYVVGVLGIDKGPIYAMAFTHSSYRCKLSACLLWDTQPSRFRQGSAVCTIERLSFYSNAVKCECSRARVLASKSSSTCPSAREYERLHSTLTFHVSCTVHHYCNTCCDPQQDNQR